MIAVGKNKAILCHGDSHPASLYMGDKMIAGYEKATATGKGRVELGEQPYNAPLPGVRVQGTGSQKTLTGKNLVPPERILTPNEGQNYEIFAPNSGSSGFTAKAGTVYTVTFDSPQKSVGIYLYDFATGKGIQTVYNRKSMTFSFEENREIYITNYYTQNVPSGVQIQLEIGDAYTGYEPYCGGIPAPSPDYPIEPEFLEGAVVTDGAREVSLPVLRAVGEVRDEIDAVTGRIVRRVWEDRYDGREDITLYSHPNGNNCYYIYPTHSPLAEGSSSVNGYCNQFRGKHSVWARGNPGEFAFNYQRFFFVVPADVDLDALKLHMKEQPIRFVYPLKTPIIEQIDPQILRQHPGYNQILQQGEPATDISAEFYKEVTA